MYLSWQNFVELFQHGNLNNALTSSLDHLGILVFSGADAEEFLQGQLTCEVRGLMNNQATTGGYLTAKGRLLCTFILWRIGDEFMLQLPLSLVETIMIRIKMYILRSKVNIRNISREIVCYGLINAEHTLVQHLCLPDTNNSLCQSKDVTVLRLSQNRSEIFGNATAMSGIKSILDENTEKIASNIWRKLDIESGWPSILPETQDLFVPQMVNLEKLGGISFKKGCYPGQEIVARMQYRGMLKRTMYRISAIEGKAKPGDIILQNDVPVGQIVNSELEGKGFIALAVLQSGTINTGLMINGYDITTIKALGSS